MVSHRYVLYFFRPSSEVVKEGRISDKIRHLGDQLGCLFVSASPDADWQSQSGQDADQERQHLVPGFRLFLEYTIEI